MAIVLAERYPARASVDFSPSIDCPTISRQEWEVGRGVGAGPDGILILPVLILSARKDQKHGHHEWQLES
ncbi:hypothetical protein A6X21_16125 [Planctopirus hydrillae]|uniref:Uncharacterized protein n=1 Tax=Planctopirus hydrillae TaxID=1841610 RepID=A0A1C3ET28_9PLAN|nr:hypothetical protein A6X21_16125 [Planctopirus hydrillae]